MIEQLRSSLRLYRLQTGMQAPKLNRYNVCLQTGGVIVTILN